MNVLNQWLEELYQELQGISEDDRKDILESYEEQINEMIDLKQFLSLSLHQLLLLAYSLN